MSHRREIHADPDHQSITGMFGGWTAAVALSSVINASTSDARPVSMTINFVGSIAPGSDVELSPTMVGATRSMEHWSVAASCGGETRAAAMIVLANRRPTEPHVEPTMPSVPAPESLERYFAPGPQGQQSDIRPTAPVAFGSGDTKSSQWVRDSNGRRLDYPQLAYLADQWAPRSFLWGTGLRPSATLTMSVYFLATEDELDAVGDDYILNEGIGTRGEQSLSGQRAHLWSRNGVLLATTEQLCWYR
ncbi:thioesterase family protein [Nocardioides humilatus]|uniref:Thioesterase family protein n=1 Tax=Nocardioides humilatus TaxID=2607660 RepID=A0A5B1LGU6_9ACTN|nr:thioesterase family protein [Nocardioides humilatus]KAA1419020.1 thioesterase family protein [Nocardioides humilatus]